MQPPHLKFINLAVLSNYFFMLKGMYEDLDFLRKKKVKKPEEHTEHEKKDNCWENHVVQNMFDIIESNIY